MAEKLEKVPLSKEKQEKPRSRLTCGTLILGFGVGLLLLFLILALTAAAVVSSTGLVKVPVLSNILKPPPLEEDFSYQKVSQKKLDAKLQALEGVEGPVTVTLTDDEFNTILIGFTKPKPGSEDATLKSLVVKFSPGVIKIYGVLVKNDVPVYGELHLVKTAKEFEFAFENVRLGALPIPGFIVSGVVGQFLLGIDQPLAQPTADSLPAKEIVVAQGKITIKVLDLSSFGHTDE